MGGAIGMDLPAVLSVGEDLGFNRKIMVQLLPSAEAGVVTGISKRSSEDQTISDDHGSINS